MMGASLLSGKYSFPRRAVAESVREELNVNNDAQKRDTVAHNATMIFYCTKEVKK